MNQQQFIDNFLAATVTLDSVLTDLPEWDSLAALGVIVMFDMEYGKTITGEDLHRLSTVGDLYRLAEQ